MKRREFLSAAAKTAALLPASTLGANFLLNEALARSATTQVTLLHTNDVHSRIEPFPSDAGKLAGQGGFARRLALVENFRSQHENVLLLDAGDYFQGTPYFNLYKGKLEIELMSKLKYDAVCIGNHDFDAGMDVLATRMGEASFPFVNANYDFKGTTLDAVRRQGKLTDYIILKKGGVKIGIYGVGIKLDGLAPSAISSQIGFKNPIEEARRVEKELKDKGCSLIVCLSHLGAFTSKPGEFADPDLAQKTLYTDVIIGAHTHTFFEKPNEYKNENGRVAWVNQVGWGGVKLGQLDFTLQPSKTQMKGNTVAV